MERMRRIATEHQPRIVRMTRIETLEQKETKQTKSDLPHNYFVSSVIFRSISPIRTIRSTRGFSTSIRGIREIRCVR